MEWDALRSACRCWRGGCNGRIYALICLAIPLLADQQFMESLPAPNIPTKIYAGTAGPRGWYSPFGDEPNDSVLTVNETILPNVPLQTIPVLHTYIMNSKVVTQDIVDIAKSRSMIFPHGEGGKNGFEV